VDDAQNRYIRDLFAPEDQSLRAIRTASHESGFPPIHVAPEEGKLLALLLRSIGASRVIEIGTLAGYSAAWIARSLPPDGQLITLERDPEHADLARENLRRAGLDGNVEIRLGLAHETLAQLATARPFDAMFVDADWERYVEFLAWGVAHVRPGGLIIAHNALSSGGFTIPGPVDNVRTRAILAFNEAMAAHPLLYSLIIPMGKGLAVALRLDDPSA
jgi:caffeoyl-CoA O-methyltransferase